MRGVRTSTAEKAFDQSSLVEEDVSDARKAALEAAKETFQYDLLLDGLKSGEFSGTPLANGVVTSLIEILHLRHWPVDFRSFAAALPHVPGEMGFHELRATLFHLGISTQKEQCIGRNLAFLPLGSFVLTRSGKVLFPTRARDNQIVLVNRHNGQIRPVESKKVYDCFVTSNVADKRGQKLYRNSWIASIVARFSKESRQILLLTFLSNILVILASLSVSLIFDSVIPARAYDTLFAMLVGVIFLLFTDMKLRGIKASIIGHVSGRLEYIVSSTLFEKLMSLKLEMLTAVSSSEQMNKLKQFEMVRDFFRGPVVAVAFELPFVVALMFAIFVVNGPLGALLLAVVTIYFAIGLTLYPKISRVTHEMSGLRADCMRIQEETIRQRQQIIERGLDQVWVARLSPKLRSFGLARKKVDDVWLLFNTIVTVATPLAIGGVIVVGATQVINGDMTGGALIGCIILSTRLLSPVQQTLLIAVRMPEIISLFRQIDAMMALPDTSNDRKEADLSNASSLSKAPTITFDGLVFRYPRSNTPALKGISVRFDTGTFTCITGPSGSGKTTLLRMIVGHYQPQAGTVLIGQSNIGQFDNLQRSKIIGHLGQKTLQIHGSVGQNLRLARPEASLKTLEEVCEEVGILDDILAMPEQFHTRLDYAYRQRLSSAFRSKFALAQVLLKEPKILLFDEPESGLSHDDHARVLSVLRSRAGKMTCLLVSQRPSVVHQADQVLILNAGTIQFSGSPIDLNPAEKR